MTLVLTQTDNYVTGTISLVRASDLVNATGPLTGTVSGATFTLTFTADFAAPFQFCTVTASGSAQITSTFIDGSYTGTNSCVGGPFTSGQFGLVKQ